MSLAASNALGSRKIGIFQVALSGLCFGFLGTIGKHLLMSGFTAGELLCLRFLLSAAVLWPFLILSTTSWKLSFKKIVVCALLGAAGYAVFSSWFFIALKGLSASLAVLLLYTYPILVAGFAWLVWGEKIPRSKWLAIPVSMIGLVFLIWGEISVEKSSALFFGVGAAVFYSIYILASSRLLKRTPPLVSLTYILTFAGLALALINWPSSPAKLIRLIGENVPLLTALVFVSGIGAMGLFLAGLQKLRPWEVSLLSLLEPLAGVFLATIFLGESLSTMQMGGGLLVLMALVIVSLPNRRLRDACHQTLEP